MHIAHNAHINALSENPSGFSDAYAPFQDNKPLSTSPVYADEELPGFDDDEMNFEDGDEMDFGEIAGFDESGLDPGFSRKMLKGATSSVAGGFGGGRSSFAARSSPAGSVATARSTLVRAVPISAAGAATGAAAVAASKGSFPTRPSGSAATSKPTGSSYMQSKDLSTVSKGFRTPTGGFYGRSMGLTAYRSGTYYNTPFLWWYGGYLYLYSQRESDKKVQVLVDGLDCSKIDLDNDLPVDDDDNLEAQKQNLCRIGVALAGGIDKTKTNDPEGVGFLMDEQAVTPMESSGVKISINGKLVACIAVGCTLLINNMIQGGMLGFI